MKEFVPRCPECRKRVPKVTVEGEGSQPTDLGKVKGESFSCPSCGYWIQVGWDIPWAPKR